MGPGTDVTVSTVMRIDLILFIVGDVAECVTDTGAAFAARAVSIIFAGSSSIDDACYARGASDVTPVADDVTTRDRSDFAKDSDFAFADPGCTTTGGEVARRLTSMGWPADTTTATTVPGYVLFYFIVSGLVLVSTSWCYLLVLPLGVTSWCYFLVLLLGTSSWYTSWYLLLVLPLGITV